MDEIIDDIMALNEKDPFKAKSKEEVGKQLGKRRPKRWLVHQNVTSYRTYYYEVDAPTLEDAIEKVENGEVEDNGNPDTWDSETNDYEGSEEIPGHVAEATDPFKPKGPEDMKKEYGKAIWSVIREVSGYNTLYYTVKAPTQELAIEMVKHGHADMIPDSEDTWEIKETVHLDAVPFPTNEMKVRIKEVADPFKPKGPEEVAKAGEGDKRWSIEADVTEECTYTYEVKAKTEEEALALFQEDPSAYFVDKEVYDSVENKVTINGSFPE